MAELVQTRFAYGEALLELGRQRPEIAVLDADLYKSTRTVLFKEAFPERFIDVGISEADMISMAAGMAASGLIAYANSFAMFITTICYLPIRIQIAYPRLPVKIVGSSAGLTQGPDGADTDSCAEGEGSRCPASGPNHSEGPAASSTWSVCSTVDRVPWRGTTIGVRSPATTSTSMPLIV